MMKGISKFERMPARDLKCLANSTKTIMEKLWMDELKRPEEAKGKNH